MLAPPIGVCGGFFMVPVIPELLLPQAAAAAMMPIMTTWYGRIRISAHEGGEHTWAQQSFLGGGAQVLSRRGAANDSAGRAAGQRGAMSDAAFCPLGHCRTSSHRTIDVVNSRVARACTRSSRRIGTVSRCTKSRGDRRAMRSNRAMVI